MNGSRNLGPGNPEPPTASRWRAGGPVAFAALVLAAAGLILLFPGDVQFVVDEPRLLGLAWGANQHGELARSGLRDSFGITYHPVAVWLYQALLLLTRDLETIIVLKAAVTLALVLGSVAVLARCTGLASRPVLLLLLSPYFCFLVRPLWSIDFMIPAGALLFALYAANAVRPSGWLLAASAAIGVFMFHIHPLAAMPVAAWGLTLAICHGRELIRRPLVPALVAAAAGLASAPYVRHLLRSLAGIHQELPPDFSLANLARGLLGVRLFTFAGFGEHFGLGLLGPSAVLPPFVVQALTALSWAAAAFLAVGVVTAAGGLWAAARARRRPDLPAELALLALLTVVLQAGLFFVLGQPVQLHYHNAAWLANFWLIWLGFEWVRQWRPRLAAAGLAVGAGALAILLVNALLFIHLHGGNRALAYGATLGNQLAVAAVLARYPPPPATTIVNEVGNYRYSPYTLRLLVAWQAERLGPAVEPPGQRLTVTYREGATDPDQGWLTVRGVDGKPLPPLR